MGRNDSRLIYKNAFNFFGVALLLTNLLFSFGVISNSFSIEKDYAFNQYDELTTGYSMLNNDFSNDLRSGLYFSTSYLRLEEINVSHQESRLLFSKKI